jgi:hypothetical protein
MYLNIKLGSNDSHKILNTVNKFKAIDIT